MNAFSYHKIFVSPHRRTILTAALMLETHPRKEEFSIILLPIAKEHFISAGDIAIDFAELQEFTEYISASFGLKFDFSQFEQYRAQGLDTWYYQVITNKARRDELVERCRTKHHQEVGLEALLEDNTVHNDIEKFEWLYERTEQLKALMEREAAGVP